MDIYVLISVAVVILLVLNLLWAIDKRSRRTERNVMRLMAHMGISESEPPHPSDAVKALALDPRNKIAAIKAYRAEAGVGLMEAKEMIEQMTH